VTQTRRIFVSRYRGGLMFAPGPALYFAPLLILPGIWLFRTVFAAITFAVIVFLAGAVAWTSLRQRQPALVLSPEGMRIEGMTLHAWSQIEGIRPLTDDKGRPAIEVRLKRGAPRTVRSPLWRPTGRYTILIHASLLADAPAEIEDAFEFFLTGQHV
jgi:hypothetical protein